MVGAFFDSWNWKYWWREKIPYQPAGTCYELAGTDFTIGKIKILMKILEFKRSGIGIIAEFRGIPSRFPNQACRNLFLETNGSHEKGQTTRVWQKLCCGRTEGSSLWWTMQIRYHFWCRLPVQNRHWHQVQLRNHRMVQQQAAPCL